MAQKSRILGRDNQLRITRGGVPLTTITAIKACSFETRQRIITEGYIGETRMRQDSIFDEVGGSFSFHPEDPEAFQFQLLIANKAILRRATEEQITLVFRYTFPSAKTAIIIVPNIEVDPVPINNSGRDAYIDMSFTYKAETYTLQA
jgi:hypothetical protein